MILSICSELASSSTYYNVMMSLQNYMYKPLLIIIIIDYYSNLCNVLSTVLLLSFKPKERPLSLKLARGCSICAPNVAYTTVLLPRYLWARRGVQYRAAATALYRSSLLYYVLYSSPNYWTPSILTIFMLCTYIYARDSPQFTPLAPGGVNLCILLFISQYAQLREGALWVPLLRSTPLTKIGVLYPRGTPSGVCLGQTFYPHCRLALTCCAQSVRDDRPF